MADTPVHNITDTTDTPRVVVLGRYIIDPGKSVALTPGEYTQYARMLRAYTVAGLLQVGVLGAAVALERSRKPKRKK